MFLHRCVSHSVHSRGVYPSMHWVRHPPGHIPPWAGTPGQTPPQADTPLLPSACWDTHLLPSASWDTHPLPATAVDGMHPTGQHSC